MTFEVIAKNAKGTPSDLTLKKERKTVKFGDTFVIEDEARAKEILSTTFCGNPVVKLVEEGSDSDEGSLSKLTIAELKKLATEEGIELTATKKDEIIVEIEVARAEDQNEDNNTNADENKDDESENNNDNTDENN